MPKGPRGDKSHADMADDLFTTFILQRSHSHAPAAQAKNDSVAPLPQASPTRKVSSGLPETGYALIVDGRAKSEFKTKEGAENEARELKQRFPMLQIKVYDAEAKRSEEIVLTPATPNDH